MQFIILCSESFWFALTIAGLQCYDQTNLRYTDSFWEKRGKLLFNTILWGSKVIVLLCWHLNRDHCDEYLSLNLFAELLFHKSSCWYIQRCLFVCLWLKSSFCFLFVLAFFLFFPHICMLTYSCQKGGWHGGVLMLYSPSLFSHCFFILPVTILLVPQRPLLLPMASEDSDHTLPPHLCLFICCVSFHEFGGKVQENFTFTE